MNQLVAASVRSKCTYSVYLPAAGQLCWPQAEVRSEGEGVRVQAGQHFGVGTKSGVCGRVCGGSAVRMQCTRSVYVASAAVRVCTYCHVYVCIVMCMYCHVYVCALPAVVRSHQPLAAPAPRAAPPGTPDCSLSRTGLHPLHA